MCLYAIRVMYGIWVMCGISDAKKNVFFCSMFFLLKKNVFLNFFFFEIDMFIKKNIL